MRVLQTLTQLFHVYFCCSHIPVSWDEVAVNWVYTNSVGFSFLPEMSGALNGCTQMFPSRSSYQTTFYFYTPEIPPLIKHWAPYAGTWREADILLCDWIIIGITRVSSWFKLSQHQTWYFHNWWLFLNTYHLKPQSFKLSCNKELWI